MTKKTKPSKSTGQVRKRQSSSKPVAARKKAAAIRRTSKADNKTDRVLALLRRSGGVTLGELMTATEWQAHSVRGVPCRQRKEEDGLQSRLDKARGRRADLFNSGVTGSKAQKV